MQRGELIPLRLAEPHLPGDSSIHLLRNDEMLNPVLLAAVSSSGCDVSVLTELGFGMRFLLSVQEH